MPTVTDVPQTGQLHIEGGYALLFAQVSSVGASVRQIDNRRAPQPDGAAAGDVRVTVPWTPQP